MKNKSSKLLTDSHFTCNVYKKNRHKILISGLLFIRRLRSVSRFYFTFVFFIIVPVSLAELWLSLQMKISKECLIRMMNGQFNFTFCLQLKVIMNLNFCL